MIKSSKLGKVLSGKDLGFLDISERAIDSSFYSFSWYA